jgi:1-acyl-sn-glycerol-3-phosphate acyltransferase
MQRTSILIVDSDREASTLARVVSQEFDVTVVRDLVEASSAIATTHPMAVILPFEQARELRKSDHGKTMIIALASYGQADLVGQWNQLDDSFCLFPIEDVEELPELLGYLHRRISRGSTNHRKVIAHNRRLGTRMHRAVSYAFAAVTLGGIWGSFVRLCFRWQVEGIEHLAEARRQGKSILLAVNHPRETDAPLYCYRLFWPAGLVDFSCQPNLLVGGRIYARNRLVRIFSYIYKFYIVEHGMGPLQLAVLKFVDDIRRRPGMYIVYPEGPPPDDDNEDLRSPKPGIGFIAFHSDAIVLPMVTEGVSKVFPLSFTWPRPFKSLRIAIGAPVDVSEHRKRPGSRETIDDLTNHIFEKIVALKEGFATPS